jgi:molecular chaperone DnaK
MTYALGIDIGTTFTAAALWRAGRAETVPLGDRANTVPSVLFLRHDGSWLVGEAAERRAVVEPARVAREFKRQIGDQVPVLLGGRPVTPQALTGQMIAWVVARVSEWEDRLPERVTLTYPANWGTYRRGLMLEAAAAAGLAEIELVTEPAAAATYYASHERLGPGALVVVYDLGGGTFDAAVLRKTEGGFELVGAPAGDNSLGGIDFDQAVMDHVAGSLGPAWSGLDLTEPAMLSAFAQVRANAVAAKEALSSDLDAGIAVILPGVTREVRLTRTELEERIRVPLRRTIEILEQVIASAGVAPGELHSVLLVGGSSRIPLVSELIAAELGVPVAVDEHPKFAVCLGAATIAGQGIRSGAAPAPVPPAPAQAGPPSPEPPAPAPPVPAPEPPGPLQPGLLGPVPPGPPVPAPPDRLPQEPVTVAGPPPTPPPPVQVADTADRPTTSAGHPPPPEVEVAEDDQRPRRRRIVPVAAAAIAAAIALAVTAIVVTNGGSRAGTTGTTVGSTASSTATSGTGDGALFRDDFSSMSNQWQATTLSAGSLGYAEGAFRFHETARGSTVLTRPQTFSSTNANAGLRIEVSAQRIAGDTEAGYGIFFRFTGKTGNSKSQRFYELEISDQGLFRIRKFVRGEWHNLHVDVKAVKASTIKSGQRNHLRGECVGGQDGRPVRLSLWVNGQLLGEATDSNKPLPPAGDVGMATSTYGHAPIDVAFDDFVVYPA